MRTIVMKIEDIKRLCDEATPGPWAYRVIGTFPVMCSVNVDTAYPGDEVARQLSIEDAYFIAMARTVLPKLLAVAEAADRFVYLRKTSHDSDEIHAGLLAYYAARAALEAE